MDVDPVILFILALAAFICGAVACVMERFRVITSIGLALAGLSLTLYWWP